MRVTFKALCVVAVVLFVFGGAGATAATLISGKQIKDSSITGKDVKNKSLTPKDFKGSVTGPQGPIGPQGPAGPQGAQGKQGQAGPTALAYEFGDFTVGATSADFSVATCPDGYVAVGGGATSDDDSLADITIAESGFTFAESGRPNGWLAEARNDSAASAHDVFVTVACARPTAVTVSGAAAARRAARR